MKNLYFITFILLSSLTIQAQTSAEYVSKGNEAIANADESTALTYFKKAIELNSKDDEAYAGASLMYSRIGNRQSSKANQKKFFIAAKTHAARAIQLNDNLSRNHYAMAVAMGRMALISGSKEKVAASRDIKKHADKAIKLDANNEQAWNVLGKWHYAVSNLNFAEKGAANMLFGGLPDGDIQSAIKCFEQSMKLNPKYVINYLDLAKSYIQVGEKTKAKNMINAGLKLQNHFEDDTSFKKELQDLLTKL